MNDKLGIGAPFPTVTLNLVTGGTLDLPEGLNTKYKVILFYRGHWWPYCRQQLVGFEKHKAELEKLGISVVAASVDPIDKAQEVANEVTFPVGMEVSRETAEKLGSWWEDRRNIIQPSEFILGPENKVIASSYCDGPLGRMQAADIIKLITFYESR